MSLDRTGRRPTQLVSKFTGLRCRLARWELRGKRSGYLHSVKSFWEGIANGEDRVQGAVRANDKY
ncbi:hypothetical protein [Streptomyces atratus]|uniref:hypothetical protein n=1 Tax=Streptomyces atratus TaxID=1893 RepID=UPI00365CC81A